MSFTYWLLLTVLPVAKFEFIVEYDYEQPRQRGGKFGCLLSPDICTPPEDCDDLTGSCQVPFSETDWRYKKFLPSLVDFVVDLQLRGFDVDFEHVMHALFRHQLLKDLGQSMHAQNEEHNTPDHNDNLLRFFTALDATQDKTNVPQELRRSVGDAEIGHWNDAPLPHSIAEKQVEEPSKSVASSISTISEQKLQHMKELLQETEAALAQNGIRLADLKRDEVEMLARYLNKILRREQESQRVDHAYENVFDGGNEGEMHQVQDSFEDDGEYETVSLQPASKVDSDVVAIAGNVPSSDAARPESLRSEISNRNLELTLGRKMKPKSNTFYVVMIVIGATVLLILLVTIISCMVYIYRTKTSKKKKFVSGIARCETQPLGSDYQELCRQHYASKSSEPAGNNEEIDSSETVQDLLITRAYSLTKPFDNIQGPMHPTPDSSSAHTYATRDSSASPVSWSEEPVTANLDISTGHAVLSYMEDHLTNKERLDKEWEGICCYEADSITTVAAITSQNSRKNRSVVTLPYDHNRIKLNPANNHLQSDYINASAIIDNDPRRPLYIAAQGPLPSTIPDFWQMMWEQRCVAIVMLTPLVEDGVNQCARYWPDEGSCTYHNFEIHLVSEHIWCEDYLVRSLYLKHLRTSETRTITQFHFLSWPKDYIPSTLKPLLELRRKVTKCYKGHNSPMLVHCSDGVGRTGTYILLDLAIDRMLKGAKEIDIAATLEHIRDQRVGMVANREQFEFALTAVAEEVNAILKTLID